MSDSKQLLYFMKKFSIKKLSTLSQTSLAMVSKIVEQMELAVKSWTGCKETVLHISKQFPKGNGYHHIVEEIKQTFENQTKIGKHYTFTIGSRVFNIHLIKPALQEDVKIYKKFDKMVFKIYIWLFICNHFANAMCSPSITIYVYMTNHKKKLPIIDHAVVDQINANTAFTSACPLASNEIYIFREEEWFKVLIHESFHAFGLDFATMQEEDAEKQMFSIFPVMCKLRFYETYTESWAEIIHVIFVSVNTYPSESMIDIRKLAKIIERNIYNEQIFSMFQCTKVLQHMGLKYRQLYEMTDQAKKLRHERYKEETHVFSYYVLKCIIMFHYNEFIEWCSLYNNGSIQFTKTPENIQRLFEFIKARYNSVEYLKTIEIFENWFSAQGVKYEGKMESETMRMSISE